jgi:CO dehydrogenase maturation factor
VLAIDADINQHLGAMLGADHATLNAIPSLGNEIHLIKEYLRGTNPRIVSADHMIKTTPPGTGSRLLRVQEDNPLYRHFTRSVDGVRFMAVGAFTDADLGVKCYHSKTSAVELLLNHLIDTPGEYVVVDMTAGSDAFASGLFTRFDLTIIVVEPTLQSIAVYEQYKRYAEGYGIAIKAVSNKVDSPDDIAFLKEKLGADMIGTITQSPFVQAMSRGVLRPITELEPDNQKALENIIACADAQVKNWKQFYEQAVLFHIKNAEGWANTAYGCDLTTQIDPTFALSS